MTGNMLHASGEAVLFLPEVHRLIYVSEGTGDNLLDSDISDGYVDYINLDCYKPGSESEAAVWVEDDGGMALFRKPVSELTNDEILEAACFQMNLSVGPYAAQPCLDFDCETGHVMPAIT